MACYFPFKKQGEDTPLPCGSCPYCLQRRSNNWIFRMQQQMKVSRTYHFITLTYADPPLTAKGFMTLDKSALQKFFKRLRKDEKLQKGQKSEIKYYAVGEYGTKNRRPHYHAIVFNSTSEDVLKAWQGTYPDADGVCVEHGKVDAQVLNGTDAIAYTAKYINKNKSIGVYEWDDRQEEFQLFSKGLGRNYLTKETIAYHKNTGSSAVYVNGFKKALPRWFKDKIFTPHEKLFQMLKATKQANKQLEQQQKEWQTHSPILSFEEFRYHRKKNAIDAFRAKSKQRKDL